MASGVSTSDARSLAPDMRTTPDFILSQPRLQFACHIRNVTPQAVSIPVEAGKLESQPRLSESGYRAFREPNRERVSFSPDETHPAPPLRQAAPEPPHEAAPEPETTEPPRSQRKRRKKRHEPLVEDIDTSA
jgi:hypothetical protein